MKDLDKKALLAAYKVDGLIITHPAHIRWLTGFVSSNALIYVDAAGISLATDIRYATAAQALKGVNVSITQRQSLVAALKPCVSSATKKIGYQSEYYTVAKLKTLKESLPGVTLTALSNVLDRVVAVKSPDEIKHLERAQAITGAVFPMIVDLLRAGVTEKEVAAEIVYRQLKHGADGISPEFWPVVAFGSNTALPHHETGSAKLKPNDVVLLDYGCTVNGYCSDMTRTIVFGEPTDKVKEVYEVVLKAQAVALRAAKAGASSKQLDALARDVITKAGYGDKFAHSLGHGLGLDVHEWPRLNPRTDDMLRENYVLAIEPGIYLPGEFGVRIEDMIVITKDGCRNLTTSPKELLSI